MESPVAWFKDNWTLLLALPMIALGSYTIMHPGDSMTQCKYLGNCLLIVFGLVMLINPGKTPLTNVGFFALGMGCSRVLTSLPFVFTPYGMEFIIEGFPIGMIYGLAILAIGSSLLYTGVMFFKGYSRAYRRMIYTSSLIFVATVLILAGTLVWDEAYIPSQFVTSIILSSGNVLMGILYGLLAVVLNSEMVRSNGYYEKVGRSLSDLGLMVNTPSGMMLSPSDARTLSAGFSDCAGWTKVEDDGPAEFEHLFSISDGRNVQHVTAQRVSGMDGVFITLSEKRGGTLLQAFRFRAEEMEIADGEALLYGADGRLLRFPLGGDA